MAKNQELELSILIGGHVDNSLAQAVKLANTQIGSVANGASKFAANIAKGAVAAAGGVAAGVVNTTKEAVAFESEMLDVTKYVSGLTDDNGKVVKENYDEMSKGILDLSTQIPYTAEELTRLAAAAGQSGKNMDDLLGKEQFLKDVAEMGTAMDISADQAGDWAAKWEVAFDTDHEGVMKLADQINYLGAHYATTAAEIAQTVNDTGSLGMIAGMDTDQTAALSTALLAMGVNSNTVATSIRRMYTNLTMGSKATKAQHEAFEELGFSATQFAKDKWINSWLPDKEAVLHPTLCTKNWIVQGDSTPLDCGTLVVDDLSYSAGPCVLTIGAVARPNGTSFHEKNQECVWKKTSIKRIAQTIADRYGLGCSMDAEDVDIALKEQDDTDSSFLQKLCSTYGLILKTYRSKIWIFDREQYKKKDAVATFTPADIVPNSLSWNTTLSGTYTGGEFTYSNQKKKVNIKVTIGTADRMLKLNQYASSEADAKRQLQAAIDNKNHSATTISFSTMGNLSLCSTMCINIKGLGKLNGKYYMDTVSHTLNKSSGLVTKVSASRVGG